MEEVQDLKERVLVTGATGLLGYWLSREFTKKGFEVYATYNEKQPLTQLGVHWLKADITSREDIELIFKKIRPEIVVHSAAFTDVDRAELEKQRAFSVNVLGTRNITTNASLYGSRLIYISTDYVFDGEKGNYSEEDIPSPVNYYGLTKLLGEESTLSVEGSLVIRISGLYGYSPSGKKNFGISALESLLQDKPVKAFFDQRLSPTYAPFLSEKVVEASKGNIRGILHIAGEGMSRYEFALMVARLLGKEERLIEATSLQKVSLIAKRPRDSSLNIERARSLGLALPSQEECIRHFIKFYSEVIKNADKEL